MSPQIDWVQSCYCVFSLCVYMTDKNENSVCDHLLSLSQLLCYYKYDILSHIELSFFT